MSQASDVPDRVTMREGVPTRVTIGAARYRFGINSTDKDAGMVHFTVLRERDIEGFRVALGDVVQAAGHRWRAEQVDTVGKSRVCLRRLPEAE